MLLGLIAMFGWGISNFFAGRLSKTVGFLPGLIAGTLGVAFCLFITLIALRLPIETPTMKTLFLLAAAGGFLCIAGLSFYKGLAIGKISLLSPIAASWPAGIAIILFLSGESAFAFAKFIGLLFIILGVLTASVKRGGNKFALSDPGIPYAFFALFAWISAFYIFGLTTNSSAWAFLNIIFLLFCVLFAVAYGLTTKRQIALSISRTSIYYLLGCSIPSAAAFYAYSLGIRSPTADLTAITANANPVVTILLALIILREHLNTKQLAGITLVVIGLILSGH